MRACMSWNCETRIAPLLDVGYGVTALIGGGGKTTLLYTLAEELRGRGTVILCTSTHIRVPEHYPLVTGDAEELRAELEWHGAVCAGTYAENGKLTASRIPFTELARLADYVLVEADGSKGLPLKRHARHEPVIPENARRVVLVVGADGFGKPVSAVCHRASEDAAATPEWVARHISAEGLGDCVFVNKVESAADYASARELSEYLICPVAAGSLHRRVYTCLRSFAARAISPAGLRSDCAARG